MVITAGSSTTVQAVRSCIGKDIIEPAKLMSGRKIKRSQSETGLVPSPGQESRIQSSQYRILWLNEQNRFGANAAVLMETEKNNPAESINLIMNDCRL